MIKKTIKIPIYNSMINVIVGDVLESAKHLDDYYSGLHIHEGITGWTEGYYCLIENLDLKQEHLYVLVKPDAAVEIIYHESLHAAYRIHDMLGIKLNVDNHESLAYLQGYIAEQIIKLLNKIK